MQSLVYDVKHCMLYVCTYACTVHIHMCIPSNSVLSITVFLSGVYALSQVFGDFTTIFAS